MKNNYALVTGASSGIGREIARILAKKGYPLIIVARRKERLENLQKELSTQHNVDVVVMAQDLSAEGASQELHGKVIAGGYAVDILVNNAAFGIQGKFIESDLERVDDMLRLNITSLTHLTQLFAKDMVAKGNGYILQVASLAAFVPSPYVSAYGATKAYVRSFSEAVRYELKGTGVSLSTIYPGITTTEFNEVAEGNTPPAMNISILSAEAVAKVAVRAMFKRKRAAIPGTINKIVTFFGNLMPRGMLVNSAGNMMKKANEEE